MHWFRGTSTLLLPFKHFPHISAPELDFCAFLTCALPDLSWWNKSWGRCCSDIQTHLENVCSPHGSSLAHGHYVRKGRRVNSSTWCHQAPWCRRRRGLQAVSGCLFQSQGHCLGTDVTLSSVVQISWNKLRKRRWLWNVIKEKSLVGQIYWLKARLHLTLWQARAFLVLQNFEQISQLYPL